MCFSDLMCKCIPHVLVSCVAVRTVKLLIPEYLCTSIKQISLHLLVSSFPKEGGGAGPLFSTVAPSFCFQNSVFKCIFLRNFNTLNMLIMHCFEIVDAILPEISGSLHRD